MHQRRCGFVLVVYYRVKKTRQTQKHTSVDVFSCSACIGAAENTPNTKTHQHGCGFMLGVFGNVPSTRTHQHGCVFMFGMPWGVQEGAGGWYIAT